MSVQNVYAMPPPPAPKAVPPPPPSHYEKMWARAAVIVNNYQKQCRAHAHQRRRQAWLKRTRWLLADAYELITDRHGEPPISVQQWEDFCWTHQEAAKGGIDFLDRSSLDEEFEMELNLTFNLIQESYRLFPFNHVATQRAFRKLYELTPEQP